MGRGVGSVQSVIEELLSRANSEIQIAIYEMTAGAEDFLDRLATCLARGIRVMMIVNRYDDKPAFIREKLKSLAGKFPQFEILKFQPEIESEDLHAKILVVDRQDALVGSANLTWKGLVGNHELAVAISGPTASKIAELVDKLSLDGRVMRVRE